jgi:cell division septum initiation protein DivIVA
VTAPAVDPQVPDRFGFGTVIRGYDRRQVEDRINGLSAELAESRYAREQAEQRAAQAEEELRAALTKLKEAGGKSGGGEAREGFGFRVEKMLRMAEVEASDIRGKAAREAAALVERARADAEAHRHGVEQKLIARAAELDQEAARRQVDLKEREQQVTDQLKSARNEAEQVLAAAQHKAQQVTDEADARAGELIGRAEQTASRKQEAGEQELRRLRSLQSSVRNEIARLHRTLAGELGKPVDDLPEAAQPAG